MGHMLINNDDDHHGKLCVYLTKRFLSFITHPYIKLLKLQDNIQVK